MPGHVHIDVVDAGPGIPPEVRDKLFTPFFTTKARGTGLGLATVRRIVEAHAGHVEILSSGKEGTTIRVTLPSGPAPSRVGVILDVQGPENTGGRRLPGRPCN